MIIISSYGFDAPIISRKYKPYINPNNKKIIILPFAGFDKDATALYEKRFVLQYGFEETFVDVFDINQCDGILLKKYDYIYVPGGNTFKLLSEIKELEISDWITQQLKTGADYIGVSAGAYMCCHNLKYIMNLENNNYIEDDFSALGLIDTNLICHADQYDISSIVACKREFGNEEYLLIRNNEVCVIK